MRLMSRDQPNLIGADEKIDTIGVPTALVAIDAAPNSPRADRVAPAVESVLRTVSTGYSPLPGNSNWKEVNLAAQNWRMAASRRDAGMVGPEQRSVGRRLSIRFAVMAQTAAVSSEGPSGADSDRLYQSLMQSSGAAQ